MRKLSQRHKRFLDRRSVRGNRQRTRAHLRQQRLIAAKASFFIARDKLPSIVLSDSPLRQHVSFSPPANFSLYSNYEETLAFLLDLRSISYSVQNYRNKYGQKVGFYADFSKIESIDAASGLVLASEIDRWSRISGSRAKSYDHLWHKDVRDFFHDAGLFELLGIDPQTIASSPNGVPQRPLRYQTGTFHEGETAHRLRQRLEQLCGASIGPSKVVYDALSEAMTNVAHHAYPHQPKMWPPLPFGRWWLGGSWSPTDNVVTVQMYDHGVGIPNTLPRSQHWSEVLPIFGRIDRERTHAGMIEAAMDYGRTSTGQSGRGKGLAQMASWITQAGCGSLRILSGQGSLTYLPGKSPVRNNLPVVFNGTLVEWEVHLNG